jgi:excisionase family DNA binding protein
MTQVESEPLLVSKQDAAKRLGGVCTKTIETLIKKGKLKSKKVGTRNMIRFDSLKRYAEEE